MVDEAAGGCAELKAEIDRMQGEFEQLWLSISAGTGDRARYRTLRGEIAEMRDRYGRECGELQESSTLPRSVTADWRAG